MSETKAVTEPPKPKARKLTPLAKALVAYKQNSLKPVIDGLVDYCEQRTRMIVALWEKLDGPPKPKDTVNEKRVLEIEKAIRESDFGCKRQSVAKLMSAVTGLTITCDDEESTGSDRYKPERALFGAVVVALKNTNGNNYTIGKACVFDYMPDAPIEGRDEALRYTGSRGNHLDLNPRSVRAATRDEIVGFLNGLPSDAVVRLAERVAEHKD